MKTNTKYYLLRKCTIKSIIMAYFSFLLTLLLTTNIQIEPCDTSKKMSANIGYYQSWAVWREGCAIVHPNDIDT